MGLRILGFVVCCFGFRSFRFCIGSWGLCFVVHGWGLGFEMWSLGFAEGPLNAPQLQQRVAQFLLSLFEQ